MCALFWLGSINKWITRVRFVVDAFFFPSMKKQKESLFWEALASHQHTVLRDIPVYSGWTDDVFFELCHNVDEFMIPWTRSWTVIGQAGGGLQVAESRSIDLVAYQLSKPIKQFWRCKMREVIYRYLFPAAGSSASIRTLKTELENWVTRSLSLRQRDKDVNQGEDWQIIRPKCAFFAFKDRRVVYRILKALS